MEASRIARQNNPQIIAAVLNEEAAEAGVDVANSASKPTISLNGTAQGVRRQTGAIDRAETGSVTAQISVPIFSGGLNKSRVRSAKHARTRLQFETRDTERAVDQAVMQVWAQLDAARRSLVASREQVKAAEVAFKGVELEQQVGTRSTLDVLNAEQELLNAKLSVINAEASVEESEFQILTVVGGFDAEALRLPVDYYDPSINFNEIKNDGLSQIVDKYVPEVVEKIASQVPDIAEDVVDFGEEVIEFTGIPEFAEEVVDDIPKAAHEVGVIVKKSVDEITGQTPD
jgi:outer membrane protein